MVRVTFEYDDEQSITVDMPCPSAQVDAEVARLRNSIGNEFVVRGQRIPKNFRGYNFD